jgi:hypothetical protein
MASQESEETPMPGIMSLLLPKVISPKTHAVIDYIHAGSNFVAGALLRRRIPHASNVAFALGAGILVNALMTDYPLGVFRRYSFRVHEALDYGIATASASMPKLLAIEDRPEARFFRRQATADGMIAAMTDYNGSRVARRRRVSQRRAA